MHVLLADKLKSVWPLLRTKPAFFALARGKKPVFLLFRTEAESNPNRALQTIGEVVPDYRASNVVVGGARLVDGALVLTPDATRTRGAINVKDCTKSMVQVGKAVAQSLPAFAPALRT